ELLWESHRPLGAYALLERLKEDGLGSQPPVIYRALDFLIAHGLAHKLERLNSYVGCVSAGECEAPHFLICSSCKLVAEIHSGALEREIAAETARRGFEMARSFVEVQGLCPACQKGGAAAEREAAEA
ncbi:MAG: transcriptional repressor, partial [Pseudomonadota bacterium]